MRFPKEKAWDQSALFITDEILLPSEQGVMLNIENRYIIACPTGHSSEFKKEGGLFLDQSIFIHTTMTTQQKKSK